MSILDFQLNMHVAHTPCGNFDQLCQEFARRAMVVRDGVKNSPRGLRTKGINEYTYFFALELPHGYEIIAEQTHESCGLPLNMNAQKAFNCDLYGPVFLVRREGNRIIAIDPNILDSTDGKRIARYARVALEEYLVQDLIRQCLPRPQSASS